MSAPEKKITGKQIKGTVQQLQDWGIDTAESLLRGLKPPLQIYSIEHAKKIANGTAADSYDKLMDKVPNRGNGPDDVKFYSYQEKGKTKYPTREAVFGKMSSDGFVAFCCASIEAQVVRAFEADHVFAFARIKERQEALLECLNVPNNQVFADAFLKTPGIEKYFRKDNADNRVKGTKRFFYDCFNDISNLLPITHNINKEKSDRSTKEWFVDVFPPQLIQELEKRGDIQEGIIIDRVLNKTVMPVQIGEVTTLYNTNEEKTKNIQVHIHKGDCEGLGDFIEDWFNKNPRVKEDAEKVHALKQKLTSMIREGINKENKKEIVFRKIFRKINISMQTMEQFYDKLGVSSEDSSEANEAKDVITIDEVLRGVTYMHKATQAKQIALNLFEPKTDKEQFNRFRKNFYPMGIETGIVRLDVEYIDKAMELVVQELERKKTINETITFDDMQMIFRQAEEQVNPLKQKLKIADARAEIADARAEITDAAMRAGRFANQAQTRSEAIRSTQNIGDKEKQRSVQAANTAKQAADIAYNIADELKQKTDLQLQEIQKAAKETIEKQNIAKMALDEIIGISANHENNNSAVSVAGANLNISEGRASLSRLSRDSTDHKKRPRDSESNEEGPTKPRRPIP